jgi:hypothetical protein
MLTRVGVEGGNVNVFKSYLLLNISKLDDTLTLFVADPESSIAYTVSYQVCLDDSLINALQILSLDDS